MARTAPVRIFPACEHALRALDAASARRRPAPRGWQVARSWGRAARRGSSNLLVLVEAAEIGNDLWLRRLRALGDRPKAFLVFSGGLPVQGLPERLARLHVRDPERIHLAQADTQAEWQVVLGRLLGGLDAAPGEEERILDAWWENGSFVVISPRFKRLRVPVESLRPLRGRPKRLLDRFEIDEDGAFVYWPGLDVHLGWEQFAQAADPAACLKARQAAAEFNRRYGRAIRRIRREGGLWQSDIKGLSARQVGRIERGACRATHAALVKLARAHALSTADYMARLAETLD